MKLFPNLKPGSSFLTVVLHSAKWLCITNNFFSLHKILFTFALFVLRNTQKMNDKPSLYKLHTVPTAVKHDKSVVSKAKQS